MSQPTTTKAQRIAAADPALVDEIRRRLAGMPSLASKIDPRALLRSGRLEDTDGTGPRQRQH